MALSKKLAVLVALGIPLSLLTSWEHSPILWLLTCMVIWIIDVILAPSPRHLIITRSLPHKLRLNQKTPYSLRVTNPTKRTYHAYLRDAWPPSLQVEPPRQRFRVSGNSFVDLSGAFTPLRKGTLPSDAVTIRSYGPLRLGARQFSAPLGQNLKVLPEFRAAKYLPSRLQRLRRLEGNTILLNRGQGSEFDSLREYVPGDDVRDIEWRVSARMRTPVVKTWRPERDQNVVICMDISRTSAVRLGKYPRLDAIMESALLLGALAGSVGDRVHLLAFDNQVRAQIHPSRGGGLIAEMANTMADLESSLTEANWMELGRTLLTTLRQHALVVFLTGIEGGAAHSAMMTVAQSLSQHHRVLVANTLDPEIIELAESSAETPEATYLAIAAQADLNERDRAYALLPLMGAQVLNSSPEGLPPLLADTYITLKKQGRI